MTGARFGYEASSFFTAEGAPPGTGQFLMALDPAALFPEAPERIGTLAAAIETQDGARLPGRRRQDLRARLTAEGLPLDPDLAAQIDALGR